jgi:hypothetical protein
LCKIRNRKQGIILHKGSAMTKEKILRNIDFKELSKSCKDEKDLSNLTKEFMKNMIEKCLNQK